ncbi:MAG: hypothetical protein WBK18_00435, partial [Thermacetogeniaceae bacterium]
MDDLVVPNVDADVVNITVIVVGETNKISWQQFRHARDLCSGVCLVTGYARQVDPVLSIHVLNQTGAVKS